WYHAPLNPKETRMIRNLLAAFAIVAASASIAHAATKDDVQAAAKKLAAADNYAWKQTVEGGFGAGSTEGKTQKDGLTWLSLNIRDNTVEVVIKEGKGAIKLEDGWTSAS